MGLSDSIERSLELEEDEKALELLNNSDGTLLSHTISQIDDGHTLIQIQAPQKKKKYSVNKQKQSKRIQQMENDNMLTPISRNLKQTLNKSLLCPSTRSRRRRENDSIRILPKDVVIDRKKEKKRIKPKKGRTHSLLDEFRKKTELNQESKSMHDDEMRKMILNQSGLSQQWQLIEKQTRKKKKKKRNGEYINVRRPQMSEETRANYKKNESEQADFWKRIEEKMKNKEFEADIKVIDNEKDINYKGRRCLTPPRIQKHLERRYKKLYENESGNLLEHVRKRKGQRVWFLNKKQNVLNAKQEQIFDDAVNNSLLSAVTPQQSAYEFFENDEHVEMNNLSLPNMDPSQLTMINEHQMSVQSVNLPPFEQHSGHDDSEREESVGSLVSGHLLPSIGSLSSIMEGDEDELMMDPFALNDDDAERPSGESSKSRSKSQASSIVF